MHSEKVKCQFIQCLQRKFTKGEPNGEQLCQKTQACLAGADDFALNLWETEKAGQTKTVFD